MQSTEDAAAIEGVRTLVMPFNGLAHDINATNDPGLRLRSGGVAHEEGASRLFVASAFSSVGVAKFVLPHYQLAEPVECSLFRRANNDAYVITAAERKFLLKIYRYNTRSGDAILQELEAIELLSARGINVALPVSRCDGRLITEVDTPEGLRYAVLFDWLSGEQPLYTDQVATRRVGRSIAELHLAANAIRVGAERPRLDLPLLFDHSVRCIRKAVVSSPNLTERVNALVTKVAPWVGDANANLSDWGFCHGDCDPSNIFVSSQKVCFFDFDWCGLGWRPYDLATFRWAGGLIGAEPTAFEPLIGGYVEVRPEAADAMRFVPLFVVLRQLWIMERILDDAPCVGTFRRSFQEIDKQLRVCERASRYLAE